MSHLRPLCAPSTSFFRSSTLSRDRIRNATGLLTALLFFAFIPSLQVPLQSATATSVLTSLAVTPASPAARAGATVQFKATGTFAGGTTRDVTSSVTWTSSKTTVATINGVASPRGKATAIAAGTTTITAAHGTIKGTTILTVTAAGPSLLSIAITPAVPSITIGNQQQFTATATYSDGSAQDVTGTASWSSSVPSVATVTTTGMASTVGSGQTIIQASVGSISGSSILTITQFTHVYVAFPPPGGDNT